MKPTEEQQAIIDHPLAPGHAMKVIAYAGTGKTSTLVSLAEAYDNEALYLAFNKSVETEAKARFPMNVTSRTGHALAYATVGINYRSNLKSIYNWELTKAYGIPLYDASILLASLELYLNSGDKVISDLHVAPDRLDRYPDQTAYQEMVIYRVNRLWTDMIQGNMPMSHSGYLKLFCKANPTLEQDTIFLDEAQDTNPVMLQLMKVQLERGKRVYFVGDPYQQIYSWRGAMDAMLQLPDAATYRLTQSFRFGQGIADVGSLLLRTFFNEQVPLRGRPDIASMVTAATTPMAIITRTNAGLVDAAYMMAKHGYTTNVAGAQAFAETLNTLQDCYHMFVNKKNLVGSLRIKFHKDFQALKLYADEANDVELMSKVLIAEKYGTDWPRVLETIKTSLTPTSPDVTISTCHKAKGLEWDHVRLWNDFEDIYVPVESLPADHTGPTPLKKVTDKPTDSELYIHQEEINLLYVACTRAKRILEPTAQIITLLTSQGQPA